MTSKTPASGASAPRPAHRPTERTFHGDTVVDPYEWLRDKTDPEVIAHLEAENAYADARTAHLDDLRTDRKSTRLNSSHVAISYAVFCLKKKTTDRSSRINTSA